MKGLLVWGVILSVIAYGAFKGLTWYQVSRFMLQVKGAAENHMAIGHGWIDSSVTGTIIIHDVEIAPFQLRKSLSADKLVVRFDSVFDMLKSFPLFGKSEDFKLPESLELEWRDVVLPLSRNWSAYLTFADLQEGLFGLACGEITSIGVQELSTMGYGDISHSVKLAYDFDAMTRNLQLDIDAEFEGVGQYIGQLNLRMAPGRQWPPLADTPPPGLTGLYVAFDDKSVVSRLTLLCGKDGGYNQQEFIAESLSKTKRQLANIGIGISDPLLSAYGTFLEGNGIFEVRFEPERVIDLTSLLALSPVEIGQALNYSVKVNRIAIPEGTFSIKGDQLLASLFPADKVELPMLKAASRSSAVFSYYPLEIDLLDKVVGNKVRLTQNNGQTVEGVLKAVEYNRIDINIPQQQGIALLHFDKIDISQAQVWSVKPPFANDHRPKSAPPEEAITPEMAPEQGEVIVVEPTSQSLTTVLESVEDKNATIVYEEGADVDTPLAEGEYFEIIEIEPAQQFINPTINDRPADKAGRE